MAGELEQRWRGPLQELCTELRDAARAEIARALEHGTLAELARPVREGAGDTTFGLDASTEQLVERWLERTARAGPLSLLTEDQGWRHRGPGPAGGVAELAGFDHGGPRIAIDPIDGTRNLMADLRPAWTIVSFAAPGASEPRMSDVTLGLVSEIPDSRAARWRSLCAVRERGTRLELRELAGGALVKGGTLQTDSDARPDQGTFAFFRYLPAQRPLIAAIEARFFERLARIERADVRSCWDDQYICSGGQLALVALGTQRLAADLRGWLGARRPAVPSVSAHPYDIAGAVLAAREAGAVVLDPDGRELDFPLDCTTPVSFVAWTNEATRARLAPHLFAALGEA